MWFIILQPVVEHDITVVSEIGEILSPQTEPDKIAAIDIINKWLSIANIEKAIGINIEKVPHEVPVDTDKKIESINNIAGINMV